MTDKEEKYLIDIKGIDDEDEGSACCGAGTYGDFNICEDCCEHC